jgi:pimeloyl-ACP methyl ester carboxylesterase/SAM-dependent methyltransferase
VSTAERTRLAYEDHGAGVPVLLLHGLTFDRTTWRPIIERLGAGVRTLAIDLPGHGETGGGPCSLSEVAELVHRLLGDLGIERPLVVGHSISGAIASIYGGTYPVLGVANVDQPVDIRPFAQLLRSLEPALKGPGFAAAFEAFQRSMGLDRVPEPLRSLVLAAQEVRPDVVLGYWDEVMRTDLDEMQARIEEIAQRNDAPYLAVFGRALGPTERDYMVDRINGLQLDEWPGSGHFVHLADVERFTTRLRAFIEQCAAEQPGPRRASSAIPEHASGKYVLAHGGADHEHRRLALLDKFHGPLTVSQLRAAKVGPGWQCLEVGAGAGAMTTRLAKLVAPTGRVLVIDLETHWLEPLRSEIVDVQRADITTTPLPGGFDLVLAQMLLLHLADPAQACRDLLAATAPAGQLIIHDADFTPLALQDATEDEAAGVALMTDTLRSAGIDLAFGAKLEGLLRAAGARIQDLRSEPSPGRGGQPAALITALTLERFGNRAIAAGVQPAPLDAAAAALRDPDRIFTGPTRWIVRCRPAI